MNVSRMVMFGLAAAGLNFAVCGANYYVAPWGDDSKDGLSWETAMKSPELVPDKWSAGYHTLIISNGTYKLTKPISSNLDGITIRSITGDPKDVVLDGQGTCSGISVLGGMDDVIDGLTVTNCVDSYRGAGILVHNNYSKIRNCIVRDCHIIAENGARVSGAGIRVMWGSVSGCTVEDCTIANVAGATDITGQGAGICAYRSMVTNCIVRRCAIRLDAAGCWAEGAGVFASDEGESPVPGISLPSVYDTEIHGCEAHGAFGCGAGLRVYTLAPDDASGDLRQAIVFNCLISGCTNWMWGPLTATQADIINTTVTNCVDKYPSAAEDRGIGLWMMERCRARGCLIAGNVGTQGDTWEGGTPAVMLGNDCTLVDSAIVGNRAGARVALQVHSNGLVSNCLFRANVQTKGTGIGLIHVPDAAAGSLTQIVDCYFIDNDMSMCTWGGLTFFGNGSADDYEVRFRNCLFANNKTGNGAIAVYSVNKSSQLRAVYENCTLANNEMNSGWNNLIHGYYENLDESGRADFVSPFRIFMRGCVVANNTSATGVADISRQIYSVTNNVNYSVFQLDYGNPINPLSVGNRVYDPSQPLFADLAAHDYRLAAGSQACDMVPSRTWMGTGRKKGPQDLGSGCEVSKVGDFGVTIVRQDASRRLSGAAADAGCCEYFFPTGMILLFQ